MHVLPVVAKKDCRVEVKVWTIWTWFMGRCFASMYNRRLAGEND